MMKTIPVDARVIMGKREEEVKQKVYFVTVDALSRAPIWKPI